MATRTITSTASLWTAAAVALSTTAAVWWYKHQKEKSKTDKQDDDDDAMAKHNSTMRSSLLLSSSSTTTGRMTPIAEIQVGESRSMDDDDDDDKARRILTRGMISIVHGSVTGTSLKMARNLQTRLESQLLKGTTNSISMQHGTTRRRQVQMGKIQDWDWWDELLNDDDDENDDEKESSKTNTAKTAPPLPVLILLLPTYTNGTWTPTAMNLQEALQELQNDWRIAKFPLKNKLQVCVYGIGSSAYDDDIDSSSSSITTEQKTMGKPARQAVRHFQKLGAKCLVRLAVGDVEVGNHAWETFESWRELVVSKVLPAATATATTRQQPQQKSILSSCECKSSSSNSEQPTAADSGCCGNGNAKATAASEDSAGCCGNEEEEEDYYNGDEDAYPSDPEDDEGGEPEVMDLEDMGDAILATTNANNNNKNAEPREMVTPSQAKALKKEGYKLIGTHSAVKLCRWTKHQLRGRGGCYKHTFYGITSYQCMEATPSLACANKCVFCWRHHKNPVGKEWRWKTDDPHFIVQQAVETHVQMIKEAKGIPGVRMDRWKEAHTVRHCALSLVGEPIMYPRIDELLGDLHQRHISTFLVTNGQHPQAIESLRPITQLYVSVDAPTKQSLIEIDRPLFQDAWDRLKQSLVGLKDKGQRTVARLTVVKGWNSDEVEGYAALVALGQVSLVEVKGVTFCGKSDASNLNMSNTPWHHEVVALTQKLKEELDKIRKVDSSCPEYGLACEHKHSCSVLLARVDQFTDINPATKKRRWRTWIDYPKFHQLAARHTEDPSFTFSVPDYTEVTPSWALFGANEEGFDPTETRHRKKHKHPKYTQFDAHGVPTHDDDNQPLSKEERERLAALMEARRTEIGSAASVVTEMRDGAKEIADASLMFRGMVVAK